MTEKTNISPDSIRKSPGNFFPVGYERSFFKPVVQLKCTACEEEGKLQRQGEPSGNAGVAEDSQPATAPEESADEEGAAEEELPNISIELPRPLTLRVNGVMYTSPTFLLGGPNGTILDIAPYTGTGAIDFPLAALESLGIPILSYYQFHFGRARQFLGQHFESAYGLSGGTSFIRNALHYGYITADDVTLFGAPSSYNLEHYGGIPHLNIVANPMDIGTMINVSYFNFPLEEGHNNPAVMFSINAPFDQNPFEAFSNLGGAIYHALSGDLYELPDVTHNYPRFRNEPDSAIGSPVTTTQISRKAESPDIGINPSLEGELIKSRGMGRSLPSRALDFMESRFGVDFGKVKIHNDANAAQLSHSLNAQAFTHGSDIYFNKGKFAPDTAGGKRLLAHELTHVVQQNGDASLPVIRRTIGDGHDLSSPRFAGQSRLESAYDPGEPNVQQGARGIHVAIIQQGLKDSGHPLPIYGVDGKFESETKTAVKGFQLAQGLSGSDVNGSIDANTMALLNQFFLDYTPMAHIAGTTSPGSGTRVLAADEITEIERLRTSEVTAPPSGILPAFEPDKHGTDCYENEVESMVLSIVNARHANAVVQEAARATPSNIHDWGFIEDIADVAKQETDRVYGSFYSASSVPAFRHGVNLFDARTRKGSQYSAGGTAFEDRRINWRVQKIIQGPLIHAIDLDHGAVQSRTPETSILNAIKSRVIAAKRAELILIDKWWPGFADPSTSSVFLQRMKASDDSGNRDFAWETFQTMVHEYIHTLENTNYRTYRQSLPETQGGKTYREGMTDYFTKIVLKDVSYSQTLRSQVEGPYHDSTTTHSIPVYHGYEEAGNAEAVVGVAGIRNAMAAFFLGQVNLIGGP